MELPEVQNKIYAYILEVKRDKGEEPSINEIAKHFSCSTTNVSHVLSSLKKKGLLVPRKRLPYAVK